MAKKSLKKRIDDLVHALGGAKKPSFAEIRGELVEIGTLVESLENEQELAEKQAAIAALEVETENLSVRLQTANAELDAFRAERTQQDDDREAYRQARNRKGRYIKKNLKRLTVGEWRMHPHHSLAFGIWSSGPRTGIL